MPVRILTPLAQVLRGFLMGSADIVPGVSGGTVALVLGIYERLVEAIHAGASVLGSLLRADLPEARRRFAAVPWVWVLSLLAGIAAAIALLSSVLEELLRDHPQPMAGLFFGLIVGAVVLSWRLVQNVTWREVVLLLVVAVVLFAVLGLRGPTGVEDAEGVTRPLWAFFLSGTVAICAMILPGVSGSFILVLLGMYTAVLAALNDGHWAALGVFAVGAVTGLAAFSTLLSWLLAHHRDAVLAALIGLMLGSLRVLWPWPDGLESTTLGAPQGTVLLPVALAAGGLLLVLGVEAAGRRFTARRELGGTQG